MSIGVSADNEDEEEPLFSFDCEPWSLLPKTVGMRPRNTDYVKEIVRRADYFMLFLCPVKVIGRGYRRWSGFIETQCEMKFGF